MPQSKYTVRLTKEEMEILKALTHKGKAASAMSIMHANVLLLTNDANINKKTDREIADLYSLSKTTINAIRKTYATEGLERALHRKTRLTPPILSKITGEFEAQVIAAALSPAPQERSRWTLRLLAEHCMEKQYIVSISCVALGEMLNTNQVKPHISKYWCIPKENDPNFVANMEDVLSIYQRPYNSSVPVICVDEKPIQYLDEVRQRIQAKPLHIDPDTNIIKPGRTEKIDSEYVRCGHGSIFMVTEPLKGWRYVVSRDTRKKEDFALIMRKVMEEERFSQAEKIIAVADNLNTHTKASFYAAFEPKIAFQMSQKFEFHYTPIHGSWLNIAECELSALARECLGKRRITCTDSLNEILSLWEEDRNKRQKGVNWQFTTEKARIKLKRLYPEPEFSEKAYKLL